MSSDGDDDIFCRDTSLVTTSFVASASYYTVDLTSLPTPSTTQCPHHQIHFSPFSCHGSADEMTSLLAVSSFLSCFAFDFYIFFLLSQCENLLFFVTKNFHTVAAACLSEYLPSFSSFFREFFSLLPSQMRHPFRI